ncbi:Neuroguidin-A like protein [Verticillium longisporum]|nr:Neuroguidin-A like protein [Verticillium longisporum]
MAAPSSLPALLESLTQSLVSALDTAPKVAGIEQSDNGISLLDVKNELLLSYLQNLVFLILLKLRNAKNPAQNDDDSADNATEPIVRKLVELRLFLEKGVRPLEEKLRYQIDKILRAADDAERAAITSKASSKTKKTDDSDESGSQSDEDEDDEDDESDEEDKADIDAAQFQARPGAFGKKVAVIGGGASAVEALEFAAAEDADKTYILSRSDKWIIPRNPVVNMLLAFNVFGQETVLSWVPELLLRRLFYRDLSDIAPSQKGIFEDTPMVNSDVLDKIREGKADWIRGDIEDFTKDGIIVNRRSKGVPKGGPGRTETIPADVIVMATGFKRPSLSFLPDDCFDEPYDPPNWYLQTFPPNHPSISAINCTYVNAIGTVGNWHIGIYTRILLMNWGQDEDRAEEPMIDIPDATRDSLRNALLQLALNDEGDKKIKALTSYSVGKIASP